MRLKSDPCIRLQEQAASLQTSRFSLLFGADGAWYVLWFLNNMRPSDLPGQGRSSEEYRVGDEEHQEEVQVWVKAKG